MKMTRGWVKMGKLAMCIRNLAILFFVPGLIVEGHPSDAPADPNIDLGTITGASTVRRVIKPKASSNGNTAESRVDWGSMARQAALFTGIQHAFRLGTEQGTRAGMKGPFFRGYANSVASMHGWGDGDPFLVNYIGHPIQGSISGFIYLQNSPRERMLRFGRDPRYWRSRMKAMGAAWVYSTLFEVGPVSEASIGKIQERRPQQGFVDHVVTPIIGTGWLITEDLLDEKVVLRFEERFENKWARMMVRSWLNPSRSFSNAMRFKPPWYRDSRGGITAAHYRPPAAMQPEGARAFPLAAKFEVSAIPIWTRFDGTQCAGGGGQAAYRITPDWQIVAQLSGCQLRDLGPNRSADSLFYAAGPRWTPAAERRLSPFAHVLIGGNKITRYEVDAAREAILKAEARRAAKPLPAIETYTQSETRNGFGLLAGAGVDVRIHEAVALRLATVEYMKSWADAIDGRTYGRGLQLSSGVILRMGTW